MEEKEGPGHFITADQYGLITCCSSGQSPNARAYAIRIRNVVACITYECMTRTVQINVREAR